MQVLQEHWLNGTVAHRIIVEIGNDIQHLPSVTPQEPVIRDNGIKNELNRVKNELEPTTKNNLEVDCIAREDARKAIIDHQYSDNFCEEHNIDHSINTSMALIALSDLSPVTPQPRWIPVNEKLPNDRDWYLGIFREPDTGWINPIPFICDYVGRETKATTKEYWILHGFTDMDEHIDYYFNLECVAWMPLPISYEEGEK